MICAVPEVRGVTLKLTRKAFPGTVTVAGTEATDGVKFVKLTTKPPAGAAELSVKVMVPGELDEIVRGSGDRVIEVELDVTVTVAGTLLAKASLTIN